MPHYLADVINNASHMFAIILSNRQSRIMYKYIKSFYKHAVDASQFRSAVGFGV